MLTHLYSFKIGADVDISDKEGVSLRDPGIELAAEAAALPVSEPGDGCCPAGSLRYAAKNLRHGPLEGTK